MKNDKNSKTKKIKSVGKVITKFIKGYEKKKNPPKKKNNTKKRKYTRKKLQVKNTISEKIRSLF